MNILFINSARTWGGTEKWVRMAAESLSVSHKVSLVYRRAVVGDKIAVHKYRLPCISHFDLYSLAKLVEIIKKDKIDILIPTKRKDYVLAGLAARICGITNILRLGIVRELKIPIVHKLIYSTMADGIIVNAEKIKQSLLKSRFMQQANIKVIYNGLDTDRIDQQSVSAIEKPFPFIISALGTLTHRKGFDFLIRSFNRFLKNVPDADAGLFIIGDGPKKDKLIALSETFGIRSRVIFLGFLQNPYPYLAASDVFAMTSTNEGISNALLEAMYLSNASISTRSGGSEEVITDGENGLLVDYGDEERLAEIIGRLYVDRQLTATIARKACQDGIRKFSLQKMKDELSSFGTEIQNRKPTKGNAEVPR
ncbi:glycosyltransferase [Prosthecochloris sp. SCSIO W1103]|uniref:glycosyltransferase n=1 Tax=Prosthecochloris sp. SCSIO W1103 TaxID=2992244 RepID=UPI00223D6555|nr:glycosyltransferase [Prosthecochloris sp. SCSIO W1103]UZJ37302.1 glycosyltransferase [Prosthecochloris sp. SCSIO W1103]